MSIYKDNVTGKWRVVYRYTDWTGKTKQTSKRGFPTKREAQMWEHEQMLKHDAKLDTYQKRAKVPSQELSDYLVKELTKKEK